MASSFESEMDEGRLPSGINTLTILTFIGSGLLTVFGIYGYLKSSENLAKMQETISKPEFEKMPDFAKKMFSPEALDLAQKMDANKVPVYTLSILGYLLCIFGAIEMRKLKMSGFYSYCLGSLLPYIGLFLFVGSSFLSGFASYIGIGITLLFLLLYGLQTKNLTK
ncbi:hypothetical protein [Parasediminibacterium sp. JCM 36343]|uniref:hypothetical protein n=1 Tax=Parasediminibacterium sp. JCM 36343 TaxID=3374279 RepID=UPI003978D683